MDKRYMDHSSQKENFLLSLLHRISKEYKALLELTRRSKPLKIVDILNFSSIPGETKFAIQVTHKNSIAYLSAAEIITADYNLKDFNDFHANIIRQAAKGKLAEFLKLSEKETICKIVSKRFDKKKQQYIFIIENQDRIRFNLTADEMSKNKELLASLDNQEVYDIGFTKGAESIINEQISLARIKQK